MDLLKTNISAFSVVERLIQEIPLETIRGDSCLSVWINIIDAYLTGTDQIKNAYRVEVEEIYRSFQ